MSESPKRPTGRMRRWAAALGTLGVVLAGVLTGAGTASATVYNGACGGGYGEIDHRDLPGGTVYLTYSGSTGNNCVVTVRDKPGTPVFMNAWIRLSGTSDWNQDPGNFTTYAGPVYVRAPGQCVDWGGEIAGYWVTVLNSHCGR